MIYLLPFIEQGALYNELYTWMATNKTVIYANEASYGMGPYQDAINTIIPTLLCPSDAVSPKDGTTESVHEGFHGNYALCGAGMTDLTGAAGNGTALDGIFYAGSRTRIAEITDGTSNTLAGAETVLAKGLGDDRRGRYWNSYAMAETLVSTVASPNTTLGDHPYTCTPSHGSVHRRGQLREIRTQLPFRRRQRCPGRWLGAVLFPTPSTCRASGSRWAPGPVVKFSPTINCGKEDRMARIARSAARSSCSSVPAAARFQRRRRYPARSPILAIPLKGGTILFVHSATGRSANASIGPDGRFELMAEVGMNQIAVDYRGPEIDDPNPGAQGAASCRARC